MYIYLNGKDTREEKFRNEKLRDYEFTTKCRVVLSAMLSNNAS